MFKVQCSRVKTKMLLHCNNVVPLPLPMNGKLYMIKLCQRH